MSSLGSRLQVSFNDEIELETLSLPRRYTLTHSDFTGDLFLTIARDYDAKQVNGLYTRFMRDEVVGEWLQDAGEFSLHLYCHVSGGLVFGTAVMRYEIFQKHMPLVLKAIYEGDGALFLRHPGLDQAKVFVHFAARQKSYRKTEIWGQIGEHK
jgi:hypothetical protein